jgi:hypothetical protein
MFSDVKPYVTDVVKNTRLKKTSQLKKRDAVRP